MTLKRYIFCLVYLIDCPAIHFPEAIGSLCVADELCSGVGCCLELDLDVAKRSFALWMKLDSCGKIVSIGFENWKYTESLDTFHLGK